MGLCIDEIAVICQYKFYQCIANVYCKWARIANARQRMLCDIFDWITNRYSSRSK